MTRRGATIVMDANELRDRLGLSEEMRVVHIEQDHARGGSPILIHLVGPDGMIATYGHPLPVATLRFHGSAPTVIDYGGV